MASWASSIAFLATAWSNWALVDGGIDVGQDEIPLDVLAFLEVDAHQLAVDLGADGHGVERAARADAVEINRDVILLRRRHKHGNRRVGALASASAARSRRTLQLEGLRQVLRRKQIDRAGRTCESNQQPDKTPQPPCFGRGGHGHERWIDAVSLHARLVSCRGRLAASRASNPGFPGLWPRHRRDHASAMRGPPTTGRRHTSPYMGQTHRVWAPHPLEAVDADSRLAL